MPLQDKIWIFHRLQYLIIVAGQVIVVLNDVEPPLVRQTNGNSVFGDNDIHRLRTSLIHELRTPPVRMQIFSYSSSPEP